MDELLVGLLVGALVGALVMALRGSRNRTQQAATEAALADATRQLAEAKERLVVQGELQAELAAARQDLAVANARFERLVGVEAELQERTHEVAEAHRKAELVAQRLSDAEVHHAEKLRLLTDAKEALAHRFKAVAAEILEGTTTHAGARQQEQLKALLTPFGERIQRFEQQVQDVYRTEGKERAGLAAEIKRLAEQSERMGREAESLAKALKGQSKVRGDWGEVVLERLLEQAGLRKGIEFRTQASYTDDEGHRFQPDVIVELPDDKCLIVDAKVNLVAWMALTEAEDEDDRAAALAELGAAVRAHVKELGSKEYQMLEDERTVDFVLLFIPVEATFVTVMGNDHALYRDALDKNVVIVSPTSLLATMRTIAMTWRYDRQEKNALQIAIEAGRMYDQLVNYTKSLEEVGHRLDQAQSAYDQAHKRLVEGRGNLVRRAEKVREMGAKAAKKLGKELTDLAEDGHGQTLLPLEVDPVEDDDC